MSEYSAEVRAGQAKDLLNNPLLKDALQSVDDGIVHQLRTVGMTDREMHQALIIALQVKDRIVSHIEAHIQDACVEEFNLQQSKQVV